MEACATAPRRSLPPPWATMIDAPLVDGRYQPAIFRPSVERNVTSW